MPRTSRTQTQRSVGEMWRRRWGRPKHKSGEAVGTEALALANIEKNGKNFSYPQEGFVTKIEHSLLYSMISEPNLYPEDTVLEHTAEEDFNIYLPVAAGEIRQTTSTASAPSNGNMEEEPKVSYAQLSAILVLSAENFSSRKINIGHSDSFKQKQSIPEQLCKKVLQCVVRHAEDNNLDREEELRELLQPVELYAIKRNNEVTLPFYAGYVAGILTGNPIPLLAGTIAMVSLADKRTKENENIQSFTSETNRKADIEKASLLDETEDF